MNGYICAWCGEGHLGVDCPSKRTSSVVAALAIRYAQRNLEQNRLLRHARRLRKLVVALQEKTKPASSERDGCGLFTRGTPSGDCEGDGHYMCKECALWKRA